MKSKKGIALLIGLALLIGTVLPGTLAVSVDQTVETDELTLAGEPLCTCGTETAIHAEDCPLYTAPEADELPPESDEQPIAVQSGEYDMTCVPGHIRIKINVIHVDESGNETQRANVPVEVRRLIPGEWKNQGWTDLLVLFSGVSDQNGVVYFDRTYTAAAEGAVALDGTDKQGNDTIIYTGQDNGLRFDINPRENRGYALNWENARIRNYKSGTNVLKKTLQTSDNLNYDDFAFDTGLGANGACIEFDLYVQDQPLKDASATIELYSWLWKHEDYNGKYGSGQTKIPVGGLTYEIVYYDYSDPGNTRRILNVDATVDDNGRKTITLTAQQLNEMEIFRESLGANGHLTLDIGPTMLPAGDGNTYAWDWQQYGEDGSAAAGVVGVRTMLVPNENGVWKRWKDGNSETATVGDYTYSPNPNHTPWLSQKLLTNGFTIQWNCYVTPSRTVTFDPNGGTGTFPVQHFTPITSLPDDNRSFLAKNPGAPTPPAGKTFVGWYKVNQNGTLEATPWDFDNRIVTETMTLRAVYADQEYTVKFVVPGENGASTEQAIKCIVDNKPAWSGADPAKDGYLFIGWKQTEGNGDPNTLYTFRDEYSLDKTSREIYADGSTTPVTVTKDFADTTVYTAQFEQLLEIQYKVVGPAGCGTLDNKEDQLTAHTGTPKGSKPTPAKGFKFVGWYKDEACTQPVENAWVKDGMLTPQKELLRDGTYGYQAAVYYAKFDYDVADLTITKTGWKSIDENQSFLFDITGPDGYNQRVVIKGDSSVTVKGLKIGTYTVKEVTGWSWRYKPEHNDQTITLQPAKENVVTFENTRSSSEWLSGNAYSQNIFGTNS